MRLTNSNRETRETKIKLSLNLDGKGKYDIATGIGFFDHMLQLFAAHSGFDLLVTCEGDLVIDGHHTVEDVGIVMGKAFAQCIGDKCGINRYGSMTLPMDEALATCTVDVSGRPNLFFNADIIGKCGSFDAELLEEFLRSFVNHAGITLHVKLHAGTNTHHKIECIFKAFARALSQAVKVVGNEIPSTKGTL